MELYRDIDIQAITDSLDKIVDESIEIKNQALEPTIDDYRQAMIVIKEFIKKNKRIIYGGAAYNALIIKKNEDDRIYSQHDRKDIEFYTPTPIEDMVNLCNLLYERKFPYVQGRQAQHEGTYSIFVNFEGLCDMSYMPRNIYENMPITIIDKIRYTHPMWILVDIYRQYNDPITSYWRMKDKLFYRANILLKHYPLELEHSQSFTYPLVHKNIRDQLFNAISSIDTIIFTGTLTQQYYKTLKNKIDSSLLEVFSTKFYKDIRTINMHIKQIVGDLYNRIIVKSYRPFFQFWGDRVEFYLDNECIIKIFSNNDICLPYNNLYILNDVITKIQVGGYYKKQKGGTNERCIKIATFVLHLNHLLIHRHYEYINRSELYKKYENDMYDILLKRREYFTQEVKTVMDNTPFKEFIIRCSGETVESKRKRGLQIVKKKSAGKAFSFNYNPEIQKSSFNMPEFQFPNISGNINERGVEKMLEDKKNN